MEANPSQEKDSGFNSAFNGAKTWEDKKVKVLQVNEYLTNANITIESPDCKLKLSKIISISGEASIAVIRGEPRMGYELELKAELVGTDDSYLSGLVLELELEDFCDDSIEPGSCSMNIVKILDTE